MRRLEMVFAGAAITSGAAWLTKTLVYAASGDGAAVGVLWGLGMLAFLLSAAAGAMLLLDRRPSWVRVAAAVLAVPIAFTLLNAVDAAVKAVYPPGGWFRDEVALLVLGAVLAAAAVTVIGASRSRAANRGAMETIPH